MALSLAALWSPANQLRQPGRQQWGSLRQRLKLQRGKRASQGEKRARRVHWPKPGQGTQSVTRGAASQHKLPRWGVAQFGRLATKPKHSARPRGQMDAAHRNLRGQTKGVRRRCAVRRHGFSVKAGQASENLFRGGRASPKAALDGPDIEATAGAQGSTPSEMAIVLNSNGVPPAARAATAPGRQPPAGPGATTPWRSATRPPALSGCVRESLPLIVAWLTGLSEIYAYF